MRKQCTFFKSQQEVWSLSFVHSLRQLEHPSQLPPPAPPGWLPLRAHSTINKSVHVQSFPTRINGTHAQSHMHNMHTDTHPPSHTRHTSHCSGRGFSAFSEGHTSPSHFISDWQYPELITVFYTFHLFLHVQVRCTGVKTTCNVFTAESEHS